MGVDDDLPRDPGPSTADAKALIAHQRRVESRLDALHATFSGWGVADLRATTEGAALLDEDPALLVSVAIVTVADVHDHLMGRSLIAALRHRVLPWTSSDVALCLRLSAARFDQGTTMFSLGVARRFLAEHHGQSAVYAALQDQADALDRQPEHVWQVLELRRRARALLAEQAPGGLLDTSVFETADAWGPVARLDMEHAVQADPGLVSFPGLLARATNVRPTKAWLEEAEALVAGSEAAASLLRALLEALSTVPLSAVPVTRDDPADQWLVSPGNAVLLRGCALASRYVDAEWMAGVLGRAALRGAASHPERWVTTALCAPLAGAAIDTLGVRRDHGDRGAREQLELLGGEITRRDLLKRVTDALAAVPGDAAARKN